MPRLGDMVIVGTGGAYPEWFGHVAAKDGEDVLIRWFAGPNGFDPQKGPVLVRARLAALLPIRDGRWHIAKSDIEALPTDPSG